MKAMRQNTHITFRVGMEELLDNSTDAGASEIEITFNGDELIVSDNGRGVPDLETMLAIGGHQSTSEDEDDIGRYGVGFNDAASRIGHIVQVDTCNGMARLRSRVDWTKINDSWTVDYSERPASAADGTFTRLTFSGLDRKLVKFPPSLIDDFEYDFSPGLRNGLKITINAERLKPKDPPALLEEMRIDDFFEDRHFRLLAGIKADGSEPNRFGYDVAYKNRLILRRDHRQAFGDYSPSRIYCYLELLGDGEEDWALAKNKQYFSERDALYEFLLPKIEPLLKKADEMGTDLKFRNLENLGSFLLSGAAKRFIREMRKRGKRTESADSDDDSTAKETGRKRRKAQKADAGSPGSVAADRSGGILRVKFDCKDPDRIGFVQEAASYTVIHLNPDFPFDYENPDALASLSISLYANYFVHNEHIPQGNMFIGGHDTAEAFIVQYSQMLRGIVLEREAVAG
jgi:hypothetical protein